MNEDDEPPTTPEQDAMAACNCDRGYVPWVLHDVSCPVFNAALRQQMDIAIDKKLLYGENPMLPGSEVNQRICIENRADGTLHCRHGHPLIHKIYFDDVVAENAKHQERIAELEGQLQQIRAEEHDTLNEIRVSPEFGYVQLQLRGKKKLFNPDRIVDLIRVLARAHNAAAMYVSPERVHCTQEDLTLVRPEQYQRQSYIQVDIQAVYL